MEKDYFLVTTALEEFWDLNQNLLILGRWCLKYNRSSVWDKLNTKLIKARIKTSNQAYNQSQKINDIYERILPIVAGKLNEIHGKNYSLRYWRISIGPWLHLYITAIYDRYWQIKDVITSYPKVSTLLLSKECFVVPNDTEEFNLRFADDAYNLQIYSKIFNFFEKKFPTKAYSQPSSCKLQAKPKSNWKKRLFKNLLDIHRFFIKRVIKNPVVVSNSYFPKFFEIKLILKNFRSYFSALSLNEEIEIFQIDDNLRKQLVNVSLGSDEFSICLSSMLFADMPKCFVEGYDSIVEMGEIAYPRSARIIFTANSWWYNEVFKYWAAHCAEKGTYLLGTPHGGNAFLKNDKSFTHEKNIVDHYYYWHRSRVKTLIPNNLPATKLMNYNRYSVKKNTSGILWLTTTTPRYISFGFPILYPEYFQKYLQWHKKFLSKLSKKVLSSILLRSHPVDHGWNVVKRIKDFEYGVKMQSSSISFKESLSSCELFVCDHISTTYL